MSTPQANNNNNISATADVNTSQNDTTVNKSRREYAPPTSHELKIAARQTPRACKGRARAILETFHKIEIHALGEATPTAVRVAENLVRQGVATITKIATETFTSEPREGRDNNTRDNNTSQSQNARKKIKIIISLEEKKQ